MFELEDELEDASDAGVTGSQFASYEFRILGLKEETAQFPLLLFANIATPRFPQPHCFFNARVFAFGKRLLKVIIFRGVYCFRNCI